MIIIPIAIIRISFHVLHILIIMVAEWWDNNFCISSVCES